MFKKEVLLKTFPKKSNFDCNKGNGTFSVWIESKKKICRHKRDCLLNNYLLVVSTKCGTKLWYHSLYLKKGCFLWVRKKDKQGNCMNNMAEKTVKIIGSHIWVLCK